jgi:hypothetical protein
MFDHPSAFGGAELGGCSMYAVPIDLPFCRWPDVLSSYPVEFCSRGVDSFVNRFYLQSGEAETVVLNAPAFVPGKRERRVGAWLLLGLASMGFGRSIHLVVPFFPPVECVSVFSFHVSFDVTWGPGHGRVMELASDACQEVILGLSRVEGAVVEGVKEGL